MRANEMIAEAQRLAEDEDSCDTDLVRSIALSLATIARLAANDLGIDSLPAIVGSEEVPH